MLDLKSFSTDASLEEGIASFIGNFVGNPCRVSARLLCTYSSSVSTFYAVGISLAPTVVNDASKNAFICSLLGPDV